MDSQKNTRRRQPKLQDPDQGIRSKEASIIKIPLLKVFEAIGIYYHHARSLVKDNKIPQFHDFLREVDGIKPYSHEYDYYLTEKQLHRLNMILSPHFEVLIKAYLISKEAQK